MLTATIFNETNMNNIKKQIVYLLSCVLDYIFCSFVLVYRVHKGNYDMI